MKVTCCLMPVIKKVSTCFIKQFTTAMHCRKMYIRHLFRYRELARPSSPPPPPQYCLLFTSFVSSDKIAIMKYVWWKHGWWFIMYWTIVISWLNVVVGITTLFHQPWTTLLTSMINTDKNHEQVWYQSWFTWPAQLMFNHFSAVHINIEQYW